MWGEFNSNPSKSVGKEPTTETNYLQLSGLMSECIIWEGWLAVDYLEIIHTLRIPDYLHGKIKMLSMISLGWRSVLKKLVRRFDIFQRV